MRSDHWFYADFFFDFLIGDVTPLSVDTGRTYFYNFVLTEFEQICYLMNLKKKTMALRKKIEASGKRQT